MEFKNEILENVKAKCQDGTEVDMELVEFSTVILDGKEFTAKGSEITKDHIIGYISKSKKNTLVTWDGKRVISDKCYQICKFYHEYRDLSLWLVFYKGTWFLGGCQEQLFQGEPYELQTLEEYLNESQKGYIDSYGDWIHLENRDEETYYNTMVENVASELGFDPNPEDYFDNETLYGEETDNDGDDVFAPQ